MIGRTGKRRVELTSSPVRPRTAGRDVSLSGCLAPSAAVRKPPGVTRGRAARNVQVKAGFGPNFKRNTALRGHGAA